MMKKSSHFAVKAGKNPLQKKRRQTLTAIIILLVLAVVGALAFTMLGQGNFDLRQQASVKDGIIELMVQPLDPNKIGANLYTKDNNTYWFTPSQDRFRFPIFIRTNNANLATVEGEIALAKWENLKISDLQFELRKQPNLVLKNLIIVDNRVKFVFTIKNKNEGFNFKNNRRIIGFLSFRVVPNNPNITSASFSLNWNRAASKASLLGDDKDVLSTPKNLNFSLNNPDSASTAGSDLEGNATDYGQAQPIYCASNADCGKLSDGFCYQPPMSSCPEGVSCKQVMPRARCMSKNSFKTNPPASCTSDEDCANNQLVCHFPPMPNCSDELACTQVMPKGVCVFEDIEAEYVLQAP